MNWVFTQYILICTFGYVLSNMRYIGGSSCELGFLLLIWEVIFFSFLIGKKFDVDEFRTQVTDIITGWLYQCTLVTSARGDLLLLFFLYDFHLFLLVSPYFCLDMDISVRTNMYWCLLQPKLGFSICTVIGFYLFMATNRGFILLYNRNFILLLFFI